MMIATMMMMLWRLKIQNYDNIEDNVVKDDADDDDDDDDIEGAVHQTWWRPFKAAIPRLMKLLPTGKIILEFSIWQL